VAHGLVEIGRGDGPVNVLHAAFTPPASPSTAPTPLTE